MTTGHARQEECPPSDAGIRQLWVYWEQRPDRSRPPYLDLCLETIRARLGSLTLEVVDERSALDRLPDLDRDTWGRLPDATRRSDYCRTRLLHAFGGLYLDADCIALAPLEALTEPLGAHAFVTFGAREGAVQNGMFASRRGAQFLEEWIVAQDRVLRDCPDWSTLPRTALGEPLATAIAPRLPHHSFPERMIAPVMWFEWGRFFSRFASPDSVLRHAPLTVMLYNEFMAEPLRATSVSELRAGTTLLSRLFRIALGESTAEDEVDVRTRLHVVADARYSTYGRAVMARVRRLQGRGRPRPPA